MDPDVDGVVAVTGFVSFWRSESFSFTGDLEASYHPGYVGRQLFAFYLEPVPRGARVVQAWLRLYQARVDGDPYGKNGNFVVDHVDHFDAPGPDSYDGQNLERRIGTLSDNGALDVKSVDVTAAVRSDVEGGRARAQFRLRLYEETHLPILDHANDVVRFKDADGGAGGPRPQLVVRFERSECRADPPMGPAWCAAGWRIQTHRPPNRARLDRGLRRSGRASVWRGQVIRAAAEQHAGTRPTAARSAPARRIPRSCSPAVASSRALTGTARMWMMRRRTSVRLA